MMVGKVERTWSAITGRAQSFTASAACFCTYQEGLGFRAAFQILPHEQPSETLGCYPSNSQANGPSPPKNANIQVMVSGELRGGLDAERCTHEVARVPPPYSTPSVGTKGCSYGSYPLNNRAKTLYPSKNQEKHSSPGKTTKKSLPPDQLGKQRGHGCGARTCMNCTCIYSGRRPRTSPLKQQSNRFFSKKETRNRLWVRERVHA